MKKLTLSVIKKEIRRLDSKLDENDPNFEAAVILLSALAVGPNVKKIAQFAKIPRDRVADRARNLRKSKVWVGGKTCAEWFEKDGGMAFWMDVCVAEGLMIRA